MKHGILFIATFTIFFHCSAQTLQWKNQEFEFSKVTASIVEIEGEEVLKIERDLEALPFDLQNLGATVDEPTYLRLNNLNIKNGVVEVKVMSRIQSANTFPGAQGFIGLAFRVNEDNSAYESIYLRPRAGRSESQFARNHSVQYYAYPSYKFDKLRQEEYKGQYETYADIGLDEWITMRIEFHDKMAKLYLNNQEFPSFIVSKMLGSSSTGTIGLWVDIGTEGYFKDLKVTP